MTKSSPALPVASLANIEESTKATAILTRIAKSLAKSLQTWYQANRRDLPWRQDQNPYLIWISEVMLQQTTVAAVIPYFERFVIRFPDVHTLAKAELSEVLEHWAGLGYYSRARLLHLSAKALCQQDFPQKAELLLKLPGFGPYTSRAVASLAFGQRVGVLDGNVIRVLCRVMGFKVRWWQTAERVKLQEIADLFVQSGSPSAINQGLMELGATVCTPKNPLCILCPWNTQCVARKEDKIEQLPLKRPRKKIEFWIWKPELHVKKDKVLLVENNYAPFLKKQMLFPGTIQESPKKPKKFDARHSITHHDIYIQIAKKINYPLTNRTAGNLEHKWVAIKNLKSVNPSSLLQKVIQAGKKMI